MLLYIAGPYRGNVNANILAARQVAIKLWEQGHVVICPHLNTALFEQDCACTDEDYLAGDLEMLRRCDGMVLLPGWSDSQGASAEHAFAVARDIPIFVWEWDHELVIPEHPTVASRPAQVQGFMDLVMRAYRVHLDKNADYSPANILGTGEIGLMTRVWDKISRLMNLMGFKIEVSFSKYAAPSTPKNESIDDNVMDFTVYGIIWQLFRKGVWGK